ncbi:ABC transporter permease [Reinekea blandensis]|uniref:Arginine ABC transporter permease protein ArtM n=1 Tax=Reinekea blandensis MED297 TaxID=314283 RepID=A4BK49_9GAMM|nr:ABC transporter permease [Reinekea blandensis]EAR07478.1 ABC-type arginine/histidine transport system, permease component [Reinekea sp. MED297] [Reinekea blandensis MED297]
MFESTIDIFTNPDTYELYWDGAVVTVQMVFLSLLIGGALAVPLAIMRTSKNKLINYPVWVFTYIFRGTPLLVQLYLIYYGVALIEGIQQTFWWAIFKEAFYPCLIAFVLNTAAYTTEIFRGAIEATPRGEIEAAKAYGMSWGKRMKRIILPSAFRRAIPAYSNEVVFMLHASAIASTVTIADLLNAGRMIYARYYAPFDGFIFAALVYLCLTFGILAVFKQIEKRMLGHLQPR